MDRPPTAHLAHDTIKADDGVTPATLCGETWEDWQDPSTPDAEPRPERARQCQACLRQVREGKRQQVTGRG